MFHSLMQVPCAPNIYSQICIKSMHLYIGNHFQSVMCVSWVVVVWWPVRIKQNLSERTWLVVAFRSLTITLTILWTMRPSVVSVVVMSTACVVVRICSIRCLVPRGCVSAVRVPWEQQSPRVVKLLRQIVMMVFLNVLQGIVDGVPVGASRHQQFLVVVCTYYTVHAYNHYAFRANTLAMRKMIWNNSIWTEQMRIPRNQKSMSKPSFIKRPVKMISCILPGVFLRASRNLYSHFEQHFILMGCIKQWSWGKFAR